MKKLYLSAIFIVLLINSYAQYIYYDVHILGESKLHRFDIEQDFSYSKTGGDWCQNLIYTFEFPLFYGSSNAVLNNTQYRYSYNIIPIHNAISTTTNQYSDSYGNDWLRVEMQVGQSYTSNTIGFQLQAELEERVLLNVNSPSDPYPVTNIPANISTTYLTANSVIDSDNQNIINMANQIISGCSTEFGIVNELAEWIKANIAYQQGISEKASDVLSSRLGDCDGMANLMIAFCRSLGIPARINVGNSIRIEKRYPVWNNQSVTFSSGANGTGQTGSHACYEVYYPTLNTWIPGDPAQQTASFTHVSNIWMGRAADINDLRPKIRRSGTYNPGIETPPTGTSANIQKPVINSAPTLTEDFEYVYHNEFSGSLNKTSNILLNSSDREPDEPPTGPHDELCITNPPSGLEYPPVSGNIVPNNTTSFSPGDNINFYAQFSSYFCNTIALNYNWKIELYHSEGTYTYIAESSTGYDQWPLPCKSCTYWTTTAPVNLPDYEWQRNTDGTIHGKIFVESLDNNGYVNKSDDEFIKLRYKPNRPSITLLESDGTNQFITFNYLAQGADSYKVYYGTGENPPFVNSGTTAHQGNSPINVGESTQFELSNVPTNTKVSVTGTNSWGESDFSETVLIKKYAALPINVNFDNLFNTDYWNFQSDTYGRILYNVTGRSGKGLQMDSKQNGKWAINYADLYIDCHNDEQVYMDFWWKEHGDEYHVDVDGIWISVDGGKNFTKIYNLDGSNSTNNTWQKHSLWLSIMASSHGLTLSKETVVRFAQKDNYGVPTDGFVFDDIEVRTLSGPKIWPMTLYTQNDAWAYSVATPGYEYIANTNYGTYPMLRIDEWTHRGYRTNSFSLLKFNLSYLPDNVKIRSAKLSLFSNDPQPNDAYKQMTNLSTNSSSYKSNACWVRRVIEDWDGNSVTYNTKPATTNLNANYLQISETYNQDYLEYDVTKLIEDHLKYPDESYGFLIELNDPKRYTRMSFASSDHLDQSLHPKLFIEFYSDQAPKSAGNGDSFKQSDMMEHTKINEYEISIYPNPAKNLIHILGAIEGSQINIYDISGKLQISTPGNNYETIVNIDLLQKGVYFVEIISGVKINRTKLIVD